MGRGLMPVYGQGAWRRSVGPGELRAHAAGRGQEPHGTAMTAVSVSRAELVDRARRFPARTFRLVGVALAVLGGAAFLWSFINGETARAWQSWPFTFMCWPALAQGMVVSAATQKLAKGHWSGVVIRLAEAAAAFLPVSLVLFIGLFGSRRGAGRG